MIMNSKYSSAMYLQSNWHLVGVLLFHFPILRKVHVGIPNVVFVDHALVTKTVRCYMTSCDAQVPSSAEMMADAECST